MGLLDRIRGNPIDKIKLRELREEGLRLKNELDRIRKNIERIEKEKKTKFEEGIGADMLKKKMLAQQIKQLDMQAKLELKSFVIAQKQYTFVKNLEIIKQYEKKLREVGIWKKITSIDPEKLRDVLIRVNLDGKDFEDVLNELNRTFEMEIAEFEKTEDEVEKELMEAWAKVEAGEMDVENVEKVISVEKVLEEDKVK